jgi:probable FeS assembly SUF system protein SufT
MMMNTVETLRPSDVVTFNRDCEGTQIPYGNKVTVQKGTEAYVGQTLGGNVTLQVPSLGLVQVMSKDVDALLKDGAPLTVSSTSTQPAATEGPVDEKTVDKEVWEMLKTCYDPEIPVNIVDLGLVYDVKLTPLPSTGSRVDVKMTLTAMGCGMGPAIAAQARDKILTVPGVREADVQIVWDPPWNQSMITEAGKKRLGIW